MTVKEQLHKIADELPEDASWNDASYRLYVVEKVEKGLKAADEGRLIPQEEVLRLVRSRFKSNDQ